jgi:hypothetical protein
MKIASRVAGYFTVYRVKPYRISDAWAGKKIHKGLNK